MSIVGPGDALQARLDLAVRPMDAALGAPVRGADLRVELVGTERKAVRNPGGFYCFTNVRAGSYTLRVEGRRRDRDRFLPHRETVSLPRPDADRPLLTVTLLPAPGYHPLPPGAARVLGLLVGPGGPVADARVSVQLPAPAPVPPPSRTGPDGQFLLLLRLRTPGEWVWVRFEKDGLSRRVRARVEDGKPTSLGRVPFPL